MPNRPPPRYLPTLTEVVGQPAAGEIHSDAQFRGTTRTQTSPDRQELAQQIMRQVRPQLEAELRNIAMELFEAQFSALLPSLHLQIEETVREAIDRALPDRTSD